MLNVLLFLGCACCGIFKKIIKFLWKDCKLGRKDGRDLYLIDTVFL